MPDQLAPCPFCGSDDVDVSWEEANSPLARVYCYNTKCRMEGPFDGSLKKAIERWNTRSNTEAVTESGEK